MTDPVTLRQISETTRLAEVLLEGGLKVTWGRQQSIGTG